jgi:hypothetical protein
MVGKARWCGVEESSLMIAMLATPEGETTHEIRLVRDQLALRYMERVLVGLERHARNPDLLLAGLLQLVQLGDTARTSTVVKLR